MDERTLNVIHHLPQSSLQEMSIRKILTSLCNNRQLLDLILKCHFDQDILFRMFTKNEKEWKSVEEMANQLISQMCVPARLKDWILEFLWPFCYRILLWKSLYVPSIDNAFLQRFFWTDGERIDTVRTAIDIIENKSISNVSRFDVACTAYLKEEIVEIWREMSNEEKEYVGNIGNVSPLVVYCARSFDELYDNEDDIYVALVYAEEFGLLEALKAILPMFKEDVKQNLIQCTMEELIIKLNQEKYLDEHEIDIGYFLFYEMNDDAQESFFDTETLAVLCLLFHSSEHELCLRLLHERLQSVSEYDILVYLEFIFHTYHLEVVNDDECRNHFYDVWKMLPASMRRSIAQTDLGAMCSSLLIRDNFSFLLEEDAIQKISALNSATLVEQLGLHQGKWEYLQFFILAEITTIPLLESYKVDVFVYLRKSESDEVAWNSLLNFVTYVRNKYS